MLRGQILLLSVCYIYINVNGDAVQNLAFHAYFPKILGSANMDKNLT